MAPSLEAEADPIAPVKSQMIKEPLKVSGALPPDFFEVTSIIGREYPTLQISELMNSPRRDDYIRDLAIIGMLKSWHHYHARLRLPKAVDRCTR